MPSRNILTWKVEKLNSGAEFGGYRHHKPERDHTCAKGGAGVMLNGTFPSWFVLSSQTRPLPQGKGRKNRTTGEGPKRRNLEKSAGGVSKPSHAKGADATLENSNQKRGGRRIDVGVEGGTSQLVRRIQWEQKIPSVLQAKESSRNEKCHLGGEGKNGELEFRDR